MKFLNFSKRQFWLIILVLIFVGLLIDLNTRISTLNFLGEQKQTLSVDVENLQATLSEVEEHIDYAKSDTAVEEWARQQGMMMQPDDHVIIPLEGEVMTSTPMPEPEIQITPPQNWEVWKALIFD